MPAVRSNIRSCSVHFEEVSTHKFAQFFRKYLTEILEIITRLTTFATQISNNMSSHDIKSDR